MFSDATECEIELEDCIQVIDFSKSNYSVKKSDFIYLLYLNKDN